jgi:acyl-CoA dehydrogenase
MNFEFSSKVKDLQKRLTAFMGEHIYPNEARYHEHNNGANRWQPVPVIEELKPKARAAGLWNLFLPESELGAGLTNLEYAPLCEIMGRATMASEVFNCSAPDTGNMEVLERYGSPELKDRWLRPLLAGEIRSCYAMTEPQVASSDATNIAASIRRDGDHYVLNGRKWWISGAGDPRCKVAIFMGKTDPAAAKMIKTAAMVKIVFLKTGTWASPYWHLERLTKREPRIRADHKYEVNCHIRVLQCHPRFSFRSAAGTSCTDIPGP